jgi:peptidoglycan/LPS O-acetylase OafA/YrhL
VFVFFIVSGFLMTQSLVNSHSTLNYLWRRFLRNYPGLFVCLCLIAFVLGPTFSKKVRRILTSSESIRYLLGNLWRPGKPPDMPSVVLYAEPSGWLGTMINGSLSTIFYEVAYYVLLALVALVGALRSWMMALLSLGMGRARPSRELFPPIRFGPQ